MGLGTINFCFQALVEKGLVKMQNFSQSKNKLRYAYLLTPAGVAEKSKLTAELLKRKVAEYEALQSEIEAALRAELREAPGLAGVADDFEICRERKWMLISEK